MTKPSPTIFIYYSQYSEDSYHSTEFKDSHAEIPKVGQDIVLHQYTSEGCKASVLEVHSLLSSLGSKVIEVLCHIPSYVTVAMGCGHTQCVPNNNYWLMASSDPSTKCEKCWDEIEDEIDEMDSLVHHY